METASVMIQDFHPNSLNQIRRAVLQRDMETLRNSCDGEGHSDQEILENFREFLTLFRTK